MKQRVAGLQHEHYVPLSGWILLATLLQISSASLHLTPVLCLFKVNLVVLRMLAELKYFDQDAF